MALADGQVATQRVKIAPGQREVLTRAAVEATAPGAAEPSAYIPVFNTKFFDSRASGVTGFGGFTSRLRATTVEALKTASGAASVAGRLRRTLFCFVAGSLVLLLGSAARAEETCAETARRIAKERAPRARQILFEAGGRVELQQADARLPEQLAPIVAVAEQPNKAALDALQSVVGGRKLSVARQVVNAKLERGVSCIVWLRETDSWLLNLPPVEQILAPSAAIRERRARRHLPRDTRPAGRAFAGDTAHSNARAPRPRAHPPMSPLAGQYDRWCATKWLRTCAVLRAVPVEQVPEQQLLVLSAILSDIAADPRVLDSEGQALLEVLLEQGGQAAGNWVAQWIHLKALARQTLPASKETFAVAAVRACRLAELMGEVAMWDCPVREIAGQLAKNAGAQPSVIQSAVQIAGDLWSIETAPRSFDGESRPDAATGRSAIAVWGATKNVSVLGMRVLRIALERDWMRARTLVSELLNKGIEEAKPPDEKLALRTAFLKFNRRLAGYDDKDEAPRGVGAGFGIDVVGRAGLLFVDGDTTLVAPVGVNLGWNLPLHGWRFSLSPIDVGQLLAFEGNLGDLKVRDPNAVDWLSPSIALSWWPTGSNDDPCKSLHGAPLVGLTSGVSRFFYEDIGPYIAVQMGVGILATTGRCASEELNQ